jgi:hypothetical protein
MRIFALCCLVALAACAGNPRPVRSFVACLGGHPVYTETAAPCAGWEDAARVEHFAVTGKGSFTYSAQTNTVMTGNDDGVAERIRRQWLAEALRARAICAGGYVIDSRRFEQQQQGRFANGGDIVYSGRCL